MNKVDNKASAYKRTNAEVAESVDGCVGEGDLPSFLLQTKGGLLEKSLK